MANAGIAFKLPLNKLPQKIIDVLLREHPILTAHFDFEEDDPPGRLLLSCDQELLRQTEPDDICQFLQNLLTGLSAKEAPLGVVSYFCAKLWFFSGNPDFSH